MKEKGEKGKSLTCQGTYVLKGKKQPRGFCGLNWPWFSVDVSFEPCFLNAC